MKKEHLHECIQLGLLTAIAVTLPFYAKLNHAFIIAALVHAIVCGAFKESLRNIASNRLAWVAILFFVLHIVSLLFSDNLHEAQAIIERRLSWVVFPLLLLTAIPASNIKKVLLGFVAGNVLALCICLCSAFFSYRTGADGSVFYYHKLSSAIGLNAVYFSAYLVFSIHILLEALTGKTMRIKMLYGTIILFLVAGCVLLSSKMMLFVLVLGVIVRLFFARNAFTLQTKITGALLLLVLPVLAWFTVPVLKERINTEVSTNLDVVTLHEYRYDTPFTGTSLRLTIWRYCYEIVAEHNAWVAGTGTGDFQDLLNVRYRNTGIYAGNPQLKDNGYIGYGPHSQYVETLLSLGITGLIVFVTFLVLLWRAALEKGNNLLLQLTLLLTLFCCTESVLSTNKGIVFFLFFIFLLLSPAKPGGAGLFDK